MALQVKSLVNYASLAAATLDAVVGQEGIAPTRAKSSGFTDRRAYFNALLTHIKAVLQLTANCR